MALQSVRPQCAQDSASNQGDSADDACFDDDASDPGQSSTSCQCSLAGDLDDDDSWMTPQDIAFLKASSLDLGLKPCGSRHSLHHQPRVRRLSKAARPLRLIGEGAANAVFQLEDGGAGGDLNGWSLASVP